MLWSWRQIASLPSIMSGCKEPLFLVILLAVIGCHNSLASRFGHDDHQRSVGYQDPYWLYNAALESLSRNEHGSETKGWARYDPKKARRSANLEAIQEYGRVIKRNYGYYDPRLRRIDDANSQQRAVELRLPGSWRIM